MSSPRHPLNAPGDFYTHHTACIHCGAPEAEAPMLLTTPEDMSGCYFHRQPETIAELRAAINALHVACIRAHRYTGSDVGVLRLLDDRRGADLCDQALPTPKVLRNHVTFAFPNITDATEIAARIVTWFPQAMRAGRCTTPVSGDLHNARFAYTSFDEELAPTRFRIARVPGWRRLGVLPTYREPTPTHAWLLIDEGTTDAPTWLHALLLENGAHDLRWFSKREWNAGGEGQELPF
jgi:hypothetical protein